MVDPICDLVSARAELAQGVLRLSMDTPELVQATGDERVGFLHRVLTGPLTTTAAGRGCHALLLTVKGHVVHDLRVCVRPDDVRLVLPAGQAANAVAALGRYAVMDDVAFCTLPMACVGLFGAGVEKQFADAGALLSLPLYAHTDVVTDAGPLWVMRGRELGADGVWIFGDRGVIETSFGQAQPSPAVAEYLRIESGEPRFGLEITADRFPMEVGLLDAVDRTKGCYIGQEPIVRIRDRGHVNWRLVKLRFSDGSPAAGDLIETDARPKAGHLTSVAILPGAPPVALGLLHATIPDGTTVRITTAAGPVGAQVVEVGRT